MSLFTTRKYQSLVRRMWTDRSVRSFSYVLFLTGGIVSLFYPSPVVSPVTSVSVSMLWAGLLAFGAGLCVISILFDNWVFEYVGLPLLSSGFVVYAVCAFLAVSVNFPFYMTSGCFNLGVAAYLFARFRTLKNEIDDSDFTTSTDDLHNS